MARTQIKSPQIADGQVKRADLNTATSGSAVISKVIADTGLSLASTGADSGTGDVTISLVNSVAISTKTSNYTAANTDDVLLCNSSGGAFTITLPSSPTTGKQLTIKKIDSSSNKVTVNGNSKTIDGYNNFESSVTGSVLTVRYNGTAWYIESVYNTFTPMSVNVYAAQFTAANSEYLSRASESALQTGDIDFTWIGWVKLDSKSANRTLVSKTNAGGVGEFLLRYDSGADRFYGYVSNDVTFNDVTANNFGSPSTGTWYFIKFYHDSVNNIVGISVNNGTANTTATSIQPTTNTQPLTFGTFYNGGSPVNYLDGALQSWGLGKSVISDVSSYYNSGVPKGWCQLSAEEQALFTGWWDKGEASGTREDSTSNNLDLTDNNTVTQTTGSRTGSCL